MGMCMNSAAGDFCDVVMKCFVNVLQSNFPTGTNTISLHLTYCPDNLKQVTWVGCETKDVVVHREAG